MKKTIFVLVLISTVFLQKPFAQISLVRTTVIPSVADTLDQTKDTNVIQVPKGTRFVIVKSSDKKNWFVDWLKYSFPVFTLLLGIGVNRFIDWFKDRKKITKAGRRWVAELRAWQEPIKQQIDLLDRLLQEDPEDEYKHPELAVLTGMDGEAFKALDKSELLRYIERNHKRNFAISIKISNQTHGLINILANLHESLRGKFNEYLSGTSKFTTIVNENLQQLMQAFAKFGAELENEYNDPTQFAPYAALLGLFNTYILPHRNDGKYDLYELHDQFFWPFLQILGHLRHDARASDMNNLTFTCLNAIKGLRMEKHYWIENMTVIAKRYGEHLSGLEEMANNIENKANRK